MATCSKDAAGQGGRDLIRKYADLFRERMGVIINIHPKIEWQPPED